MSRFPDLKEIPNSPEGIWWRRPTDPSSAFPTVNQGQSEGAAAFVAVVIFTLILLLSPQNWIPALAPLRIAFLAAGAAAFFLLWDRWRRKETLLNFNTEVVVALALPAWAILTLPLSYWPGGSAAVLHEPYIKALAIFWLLANIVTTVSRLRFVAMTLILCTLPLAITAMRNFAAGKFVAGSDPSVGRIVGYQNALTANPNDLALMLNLVMPLGLAMVLSSTRLTVRLLCLFAVGLSVLGVILTFSRAGFLGLATIGLVCFFKLVRRPAPDRSWAFAVLALAVLALPLLPSAYVNRITTITDIEADPTGSAQTRWQDTVAATQFVMAHPIVGAGLGMDVLALNEVRGTAWKQVHNVFLQYAVDLGFPGLVLFLFLYLRVFGAARASRRRAQAIPALRQLFLLNEGLEVSLIVFAVAGLFHPAAYHFYFYYMAGLALGARSATEDAVNYSLATSEASDELSAPLVSGRRLAVGEVA